MKQTEETPKTRPKNRHYKPFDTGFMDCRGFGLILQPEAHEVQTFVTHLTCYSRKGTGVTWMTALFHLGSTTSYHTLENTQKCTAAMISVNGSSKCTIIFKVPTNPGDVCWHEWTWNKTRCSSKLHCECDLNHFPKYAYKCMQQWGSPKSKKTNTLQATGSGGCGFYSNLLKKLIKWTCVVLHSHTIASTCSVGLHLCSGWS